ncbi:L-lactate permease [Olivibacter sp. SDN3]|uniref:L-lactate permease n=1 Tax=Olivibacter sp. SDN3 TaxID=2764720 RepID=UPI0016510C7D|nr:L-lactate permease [Olivibacter sp. SDN3]QNL50210.1 L-lactate permease [Olivibacter sp. SDN3]
MAYLLSLLPIFSLLVLSLTKGVKTAVMFTCVLTVLLFFYWGAGFARFFAGLSVSALTTLNILMIVLGATFLYNIMSHTGMIDKISHSLDDLSNSRAIRFFIVAFGLTSFFEGVAGFGTPGAIVPLILIAMGYEPMRSIAAVLLFDCLFSLFGAVGTPIISGLQHPLQLSYITIQHVSFCASVLISLAGLVLIFLIFHKDRKKMFIEANIGYARLYLLYTFFVIPFCVSAWFAPELASVIGALSMLFFSFLYLRKANTKINFTPWVPYALLALLLLLPKVVPRLRNWLVIDIHFNNILDTGINGSLQPLLSPLFPFILVGLCVIFYKKSTSLHLRPLFIKIWNVSLVLYPSIVIAQLMIISGVQQPSMVQNLATMMSQLGDVYPIFAPFIGMVGTFITGSTTLSNIVFAPSQLEAAHKLLIDEQTVLSLQLSGASAGNGICLFNIIAAASIAGIQNYRAILTDNIIPTLWMGAVIGLIGFGLIYVA